MNECMNNDEEMCKLFFSFPAVEVSRLEDIESLSHVNLQNNPISDDLKSQLQSCNFTVMLGNEAVS